MPSKSTMRAVQFWAQERKIDMVEVPRPTVKLPRDVLIRVLVSGVSDVDLQVIEGCLKLKNQDPFVLGRECCGVVCDVGDNVTSVHKGSRVVVDPVGCCKYCKQCRSGKSHLCLETRDKITVLGTWARYVCVHESQTYKIPPELALDRAIFAEATSRILQSWELISPIKLHETVLVSGAGVTGIIWACLLHYRGFRKVSVCDPNLARLEILEKMQLDFIYLAPVVLYENLKERPNLEYDVIVDCTACPDATEFHVGLLAAGGRLCVCRAHPKSEDVKVNAHLLTRRNIQIVGVDAANLNFGPALEVLALLTDRYLDYEKLCVKTYDLEAYKDAIKHTKKKSVVKAVFDMGVQCVCKKVAH